MMHVISPYAERGGSPRHPIDPWGPVKNNFTFLAGPLEPESAQLSLTTGLTARPICRAPRGASGRRRYDLLTYGRPARTVASTGPNVTRRHATSTERPRPTSIRGVPAARAGPSGPIGRAGAEAVRHPRGRRGCARHFACVQATSHLTQEATRRAVLRHVGDGHGSVRATRGRQSREPVTECPESETECSTRRTK